MDRYPRTLKEAFGPHTGSRFTPEPAGAWDCRSWLLAALGAVYLLWVVTR